MPTQGEQTKYELEKKSIPSNLQVIEPNMIQKCWKKVLQVDLKWEIRESLNNSTPNQQ